MTGKQVLQGAVLLALGVVARGDAQVTTQRVTIHMVALNRMSVSGNPAPFVVRSATAGAAPTPVTAPGATYAITTNERNRKITAALDAALPEGVTLEVRMAAPGDAVTRGFVVLGTTDVDTVTDISTTVANALPITYRLSAAETARVSDAVSRIVTFTIAAAP